MSFKQVLFPFDYSDSCRYMALSVDSLIEKTRAHLTILNVVEDPNDHYPANGRLLVPKSESDEILESSTRFLKEYARETFPGYAVEAVCRMGNPAKEIVSVAAKTHADLIMMPTRGGGLFRPLILGSVTAKVLEDAKCPVWTDAHINPNERRMVASTRNILCAVDWNAESGTTLETAFDLAAIFSATLRLVHVVLGIDITPEVAKARWKHHLKKTAHAKISAVLEEAVPDTEICVRAGTVSEIIRRAALEYKADLVVIGRGHVQALLGRLRTHTYGIIRDCPCPVLIV